MLLKHDAGTTKPERERRVQLSGWKISAGVLALFLIGLSAEAGPLFQTDFSAGFEIMSGTTEYRVGGEVATGGEIYNVHFPVSRLSFPVDGYLFSLRAGVTVVDRLTGSVSWGKDLAGDPGKMKDYDWETTPGALSIYSESSLNMDAQTLSAEIRYRLFQVDLDQQALFFHPGDNWQLLVGGEYHYRHFDFAAYDTRQTYPGQSVGPDYVSGRTLEYDVDYLIPLLKLVTALELTNGVSAEMAIGYSPYARTKDEDRHLLRNMISRADCDGDAWMFSCRLKYLFAEKWFAALFLSYLEVETDGTSKTYINGLLDHTIYTEISGEQPLATLTFGRAF